MRERKEEYEGTNKPESREVPRRGVQPSTRPLHKEVRQNQEK
jgi:hypothetical protein